jgi:hypothetical protein
MNFLQAIISGGLERFRSSKEFAALVAEARLRHDADLRGAPFWRRAWLEVVIELEVRAKLRRLFPPGALYTLGSPNGGA